MDKIFRRSYFAVSAVLNHPEDETRVINHLAVLKAVSRAEAKGFLIEQIAQEYGIDDISQISIRALEVPKEYATVPQEDDAMAEQYGLLRRMWEYLTHST